ncbi:MAG TPA: glucan biosynthesis protein [Steroidobacteraceae bacterium]|nr:glucan biosynthesis protein [Steroidobacteraceae bacterium]
MIAAALLTDATGGPADVQPAPVPIQFSFASVDKIARDRAAEAYKDDSPKLPDSIANLGYDQYRDIRYRPADAIWRGQSMFEVQLFHRGFNFARRVNISEVSDAGVRPILYSPSMFEFGKLVRPAQLPPETGFAGFRVHYPLHTPAYKDEVLVFLGASYFRMLGRNQGYGLSARGLALDTATERGEEFPSFTDFWLVRPKAGDRQLTIYAVLDSKGVTGAYRFDLRPGSVTQVEVSSKLYPRRVIDKLGIAPLTSMFLFGENPSGRRFDDFRPEVHDSDGLLINNGAGEWLWRPLVNPSRDVLMTSFMDDSPHGFGLVQRDRDFRNYQDNESRFERRPSYWIEPLGRWGKGRVELVELPSREEIHDNIVAYWVPAGRVEAQKPLAYSYLISAYSNSTQWPPGGKVIATRVGNAGVGGYDDRGGSSAGQRRVLIDFAGGDLEGLNAAQPVKAEVKANGGDIDAVTVEQLPGTNTWRVAFRLTPKGDAPVDMRCYLSLYGEAMTETWSYLWSPQT